MAPKKGEKMTQNKSKRASCPAWCTSSHASSDTDLHLKSFGNFVHVWATLRGNKVASSGIKVEIEDLETEDDLLSLIGADWNQAIDWHEAKLQNAM